MPRAERYLDRFKAPLLSKCPLPQPVRRSFSEGGDWGRAREGVDAAAIHPDAHRQLIQRRVSGNQFTRCNAASDIAR
jgi:hypothetical protein